MDTLNIPQEQEYETVPEEPVSAQPEETAEPVTQEEQIPEELPCTPKKPFRPEWIMGIIAVLCALLLGAVLTVSLP